MSAPSNSNVAYAINLFHLANVLDTKAADAHLNIVVSNLTNEEFAEYAIRTAKSGSA